MISMRIRSLTVLVATVVLAVSGATASLAQAAVTPGDPLDSFDFQDPVQTGCSADAETVGQTPIHDSRGNNVGDVELRWSPSCQTNWARITSTSGAIFNPQRDMAVEIKRRSDGAFERIGVDGQHDLAADPGGDANFVGVGEGNYQGATSLYTDMLYSPGPAEAIGTFRDMSATYVGTYSQTGSPF